MQYLVIEGNIGAGKTTLSKMLADDTNAKLILEQYAENSFLPKFYENQEKYSFPLELSFLTDRYKQTKTEILNLAPFHTLLIADYHFSKTSFFAQNTLKNDEYRLFKQIFEILSESMPKPDLYVYLHASIEKLMNNIKKRGLVYEKDIDAIYLKKIERGYFSYLNQVTNFPVLIVETNNFDFVQNPDHFHQIKNAIFNSNYKLGVNRLIF